MRVKSDAKNETAGLFSGGPCVEFCRGMAAGCPENSPGADDTSGILDDGQDGRNSQSGGDGNQSILDGSRTGVVPDEARDRSHSILPAVTRPVADLCGSGPSPFTKPAGDALKPGIKAG